jgi:hypothetical protein
VLKSLTITRDQANLGTLIMALFYDVPIEKVKDGAVPHVPSTVDTHPSLPCRGLALPPHKAQSSRWAPAASGSALPAVLWQNSVCIFICCRHRRGRSARCLEAGGAQQYDTLLQEWHATTTA